MSSAPRFRLSPAQYLARERAGEARHEYFQGEVFAMVGGSEPHSLIKVNLITALRNRLREGCCRVYDSDLRVKVAATGLYTYPDASIVCGPSEFEDDQRDTLLNPCVLVEVLSPSTEKYDRGKKFDHYRQLASLAEYLLVAQDEPRVESYRRAADGWRWTAAQGLDSTLALAAASCEIPLAELYQGVPLPPAS